MVTMGDDSVASSLAMLGRPGEAGMDQRLARFRGRLRELRDDPAEAARIDALVAEAEREEQDPDAASGNDLTVYVNGGVVNITHGQGQATTMRSDAEERLAALELELARLKLDLQATRQESRARPRRTEVPQREAPSRTRPRQPWEVVLAPIFGSGVLVAILAGATVVTALHAAVLALTVIASALAVATASIAFLSAWMPLTSVRKLIRQGDAALALELLSRGSGTSRFPARAGDEEHAATEIDSRLPKHPPSLAPELGLPERPSRLSVCPRPDCGQLVDPDDQYCGTCGSSLSAAG
jgi:hypothetical protein